MAAGLGFKTFTTGEVLTAADVNGYLMQGVLVFATEAARNSAITVPQEGQFAFTKDTNSLWYYSGVAWVASGATGDIEGVTAGTGISGGGTSGTVTITNSMATEITAKADLIVGTGNAAFDNLPVGTNGHVLTADSTVSPTGLKWAAPAVASSSFSFISRTSFSNVASQAFDNVFTSTYQKYYVALDNMAAATNANDLHLQFRYAGPTTETATYFGFNNNFTSSAEATTYSNNSSEFIVAPNTGDTGDYRSGGYFYFTNVGNSSQPALVLTSYADASNPSFAYGGGQNNTARIYTGFLLKASGSNITGTVTIYGLANS